MSGALRLAGQLAGASVDVELDVALLQTLGDRGHELRRHRLVHQKRLGRVADPRPLAFGVDGYVQGLLEIGRLVDIHVAVAAGGVDDRHFGMLEQEVLEGLAAAGDDQIHLVSHLQQIDERRPGPCRP